MAEALLRPSGKDKLVFWIIFFLLKHFSLPQETVIAILQIRAVAFSKGAPVVHWEIFWFICVLTIFLMDFRRRIDQFG